MMKLNDFIELKCNVTVTNNSRHNNVLNDIYPINADGYLIPLHAYDVYMLITDKNLFILNDDVIRVRNKTNFYNYFDACFVSLIVYDHDHWKMLKDREYVYLIKEVKKEDDCNNYENCNT